MKTVKQVLKESAPEAGQDYGMETLIQSGLIKEENVSLLRRTLSRDPSLLTIAEKKCLIDIVESLIREPILVESLISESSLLDKEPLVTTMTAGYKGYVTARKIPAMIMLKRKSIRTFPNNQVVALYFAESLGKYITIPFGPDEKSSIQANMSVNEEEINESVLGAFNRGVNAHNSYRKAFGKVGDAFGNTRKDIARDYRKSINAVGDANNLSRPEALKDFRDKSVQAKLWRVRDDTGKIVDPLENLKRLRLLKQERKNREKMATMPKRDLTVTSPPPPTLAESFKARLERIREERESLDFSQKGLEENKAMDALKYVGRAAKKGASSLLKNLKKGSSDSHDTNDDTEDKSEEDKKKNRKPKQSPNLSRDRNIGYNQINPHTAVPGALATTARITPDLVGVAANKKNWGMTEGLLDKTTLGVVKNIVENNLDSHDLVFGKNRVSLNNRTAKKLLTLYESLNKKNRKIVESLLDQDVTSFRKVVDFAVRQNLNG